MYTRTEVCVRSASVQSSASHDRNFAHFLFYITFKCVGFPCHYAPVFYLQFHLGFKTVTKIWDEWGGNMRNWFQLLCHPACPRSLWMTLALVPGRNPDLGQHIYKYYKYFLHKKNISFIYCHPQKAEKCDKSHKFAPYRLSLKYKCVFECSVICKDIFSIYLKLWVFNCRL